MKTIKEYINEQNLITCCHKEINENKEIIKLPYTFDIYNEGPKNKDYRITKSTIYKIFFNIDKVEKTEDETGITIVKFIDNHSQMIKLPLPASEITYKVIPTKESTKNWTEIPEIQQYTYAGAWYSNKNVEYNYKRYNEDWNKWFNMIKPYMKGKISVTITEEKSNDGKSKILVFNINNDQFNKEREEKIKEMSNVDNLRSWAEDADSKEKAEIKKREEEETKRKEAEIEWKKWWDSLSDDERLSYTMGYNNKSGNWTGD